MALTLQAAVGNLLMVAKKMSSLDRVLGRLESMDSVNLTNLVQRLARERKLLETVFNTLREGILVIDRHGVIEYANEASSRLIGLKEEEIGKITLWKLVPDLAKSLETNLDALRPKLPLLLREIEISYPETRYLRLYIVPFREEAAGGGEADEHDLAHFAVILHDITQEKLSTEEMIENEKVSSILLLAGGVAHELGNPLNTINIHLQLIERQLKKLGESPVADKIRESAEICSAEVGRLDGVIDNFLKAIRPSPPDLQNLQLLDLIEEVLRTQAGEFSDRGIRVDVELSRDLPLIPGDRNQLKQVFFNIFRNAMDAMETGGHLRVRASSDDTSVYLQVADTGEGISRDNLSKVFQPYYTSKKKGHGLGMMIVQRIMRDHGGQVGIESQEGIGTVIFLQFVQKHRRARLLKSRETEAQPPE